MSITFLLFVDHYFLKDEKKYTWVVRKWSRSVSGAPTVTDIFNMLRWWWKRQIPTFEILIEFWIEVLYIAEVCIYHVMMTQNYYINVYLQSFTNVIFSFLRSLAICYDKFQIDSFLLHPGFHLESPLVII